MNGEDTHSSKEAETSSPQVPFSSTKGDANTLAMLCHLLALCGLLPIIPVLGNVLGPLVLWLMKKEEIPEVDRHGKESLNFQISILVYMLGAGILFGVGFILSFILIGIPIMFLAGLLFIVIAIVDIVLVIIASIKASKGEFYAYPFTLRMLN